MGDYVAGPNHVLPTGRRARFSSGLSVLDFMKRTSFLALDPTSLARIGPAAIALATAEGLPAHARSVSIRLSGDKPELKHSAVQPRPRGSEPTGRPPPAGRTEVGEGPSVTERVEIGGRRHIKKKKY